MESHALRVTDQLVGAIEPDKTQGEPPNLPHLNRHHKTETTVHVYFEMLLPVIPTCASHLNYVACHTAAWEQAATLPVEQMARVGIVECYVRNNQRGFTIPYEVQGEERAYGSDFIV